MYRFLNYFSIITLIALFGTDICSANLEEWHKLDDTDEYILLFHERIKTPLYWARPISSETAELRFLDNNRVNCSITSELFPSFIEYPGLTTILGNGKILIALKENSEESNNDSWYIMIVDSGTCSHKVLNLNTPLLFQIIPHEARFDVILAKSYKYKSVVTYDDTGKYVSNSPMGNLPSTFLKILVGSAYKPKPSYYSISTPFRATTSNILKMNSEYKIINMYSFNHSIYWNYDNKAYSAEDERFTVCYYNTRSNLTCLMLDGDLNKLREIPFEFEEEIAEVNVRNGPNGIVLLMYGKRKSDNYCIYGRILDTKDNLGKPVEIKCEKDKVYAISVFKIEGTQYCVSYTLENVYNTKCFDFNALHN